MAYQAEVSEVIQMFADSDQGCDALDVANVIAGIEDLNGDMPLEVFFDVIAEAEAQLNK